MYFIVLVSASFLKTCFRDNGLEAALVYLFGFCVDCALAGRSCWSARHVFLLPGHKFSRLCIDVLHMCCYLFSSRFCTL